MNSNGTWVSAEEEQVSSETGIGHGLVTVEKGSSGTAIGRGPVKLKGSMCTMFLCIHAYVGKKNKK